jgi:hypothetical protein
MPIRTILFGMVLLSVGCHSYKPMTTPAAAASQTARVQFSQPRRVVTRTTTGSDSVLIGVSSLEGHVLAATSDTLELTITKVADALGKRDVTTSLAAKIALDPSVAVDVLSYDANRTAALSGGAVYALAVVTVLALVAALYAAGSGW